MIVSLEGDLRHSGVVSVNGERISDGASDDRPGRGTGPLNVHVPKVAELVAAHLRAQIVKASWPTVTSSTARPSLLQEFGVSRPSLREALRVLETEGLVQIRRGNVGGAIVRRPTAASAAYHLSLTLRANDVTHRDLGAARSRHRARLRGARRRPPGSAGHRR